MRAARRAALLLVAVLLSAQGPARAGQRVSLELVLAVDCSLSVDDMEFELQMRGIAAAFRTPDVIDLIGRREGGVAVALMQWGGIADVEGTEWHLLSDPRSVLAYADLVDSMRRFPYGYLTGMGKAILSSVELMGANAYDGRERKIDVSGDGRNNSGPEMTDARDHALGQGVTINGLAILNSEPGLGRYFEREVIGGKGAFVIEASDYQDFAAAVLRKLIRELELDVSVAPDPPRFARAPALYVAHD
jgi:hypothetical protein